jgi:hypothetical protein
MNESPRRSLIKCAEQTAVSYQQWLVVFLVLSLLIFAHDVSYGKSLKIMITPMESMWTTNKEPFTQDDNPFHPYIVFDNITEEWKNQGIGYHHWLCGELYKFAQEKGITIILRFISWPQAHNEIDSLAKDFDLIEVPSTWTAYLIKEGFLAKWDDDIYLQSYPNKLVDTCRIQGKKDYYAVPWKIDLRVLFYSSELTSDPNNVKTFQGFARCLESRKSEMAGKNNSTWQAPFCVARDCDWDILHNTLRYFWHGQIIQKRFWIWWTPVFQRYDQAKTLENFRLLAEKHLVFFEYFAEPGGKPGWYEQAEGLLEGKYDALWALHA